MKLHFLVFGMTLLASPLLAQTQAPENGSTNEAPTAHQEWRHRGWLWRKLNLTDAQKQQVREIMQSNRPQFKASMLAVLNAQKAVDEAIAKNPNDEATIRSLSTTLESARTEQSVQRARLRAQILKILTPDQQQQLVQINQKRSSRLQERIDHLNQSAS